VLVRITSEPELTRSRADGADLYFTSDDGESQLDHEIESFDRAEGSLRAWVALPSVSDSEDTVFYLYFGDGQDHSAGASASGVWDSDYEGVWHLGSSYADSSSKNRDGTNNGASTASGQIGEGSAFTSMDYVRMGVGLLPNEQLYTISAWVYVSLSSCLPNCAVLTNQSPPLGIRGINLYVSDQGAVGIYENTAFRYSANGLVTANTWTYLSVTTDNVTNGPVMLSVNGAAPTMIYMKSSTADSLTNDSTTALNIGRYEAAVPDHYFQGRLDEVRVSSTHRSAAWVKAEHENQKASASFLSWTVE
jgi:hypothetical protein